MFSTPTKDDKMNEEVKTTHEVRVHIDRKKYKSENHTTHHKLYELGQVAADLQLFREKSGERAEDTPIRNDARPIHLDEDEHFYSTAVTFDVFVNSRKKVVTVAVLSYEDVLKLAFDPVPSGPGVSFSVSYSHGHHEGILVAGQTVNIEEGFNFNVTKTDKS
jgi:hypothetical protein